ncbi:alpha/beta fold hydrolase [Nocardia sp. NBC_01327]|uniref:alpha/beta fold hydrolase n=1 Tax=Nocardia sp. NBC_01327 TaxID=2903593 RepID=UPI002E154394|nr:alpha/beta hydrolase [Nocardia sp. NBC_01327]
MASTAVKSRARIGDLITVQGRPIHVRQDGPADGKPVLLLHGFEGSVHWWDAVTPLLADTYRVIRVDLLGFGCTGGDYGFDQEGQGSMLAALLTELGVANVAVVGHSWGADAALAVAARSPRISEIVVLDQAPDLSYLNVPAATPLLTLGPIARVLQRFAPEPIVRQALRAGFAPKFDLAAATPSVHQMFLDHQAMSWRAYRAVSVDRRKALAANPLDRQIRRLALPALVIHGRLDGMYDWAVTRDRYTAAGARFELIDTAGHSPNVETPAAFTTHLRDFLAAPAAPSPAKD